MAETIVKVNTWAFPNCPYKQHHDPANELEMNEIFYEDRYAGRPKQACPACYAGENPQREKGVHYLEAFNGAHLSQLGQKQVTDDATLEVTLVPELDADGDPVMVQTSERQEIGIVNGQIGIVTHPVYAPTMRSLTSQELAELKLQRDQNLDALEKVAVKGAPDESD